MNVDVIGMCRGGAKVFFKLLVRDVDSENLVSLSAQSNGKSIPLMVFEGDSCIPVSKASNARDFVIIVPQLRVDVSLSVDLLSPSLEHISHFEYAIRPFEAKWRSRMNRVFHSGALSTIRNCDLKRTLGRAVVSFNDCVVVEGKGEGNTGNGECIYHGTAYIPCELSSADITLKCFDELFESVDALFTYSPVRMTEESPDKTAPLWELDFAMRVPASLKGFTVIAANEEGEEIVGFESVSGKQISDLRERVAHYSVNAWNDAGYHTWFLAQRPSQSMLEVQRTHRFPSSPSFSLIVESDCDSGSLLQASVDSVLAQTYPFFELVIALSDCEMPGERLDSAGFHSDPRIVVLKDGGDDAFRIRDAIAAATGDYIAFIAAGDVLEPDTLFEFAKAVNDDLAADALYCDEDRLLGGGTFAQPSLKPAFSIDYLRSTDYVGHLLAVRSQIVREILPAYDFSNDLRDYDYALRVAERTRNVAHIDRILYHRCVEDGKSADGAASKANKPAREVELVQAHLDRLGISAGVSSVFPGCNRVDYRVVGNPLVSIIIPSKDSSEMLSRCIASIEEKTLYDNYEIVVVENNSTDSAAFDYYERIHAEDGRVRVAPWRGEGFNYSSLVNFGRAQARGEYLLLLNNDVEVISPDWVGVMLGYCQRDEIGAVGVKLRFPDETVQHAGVVVTNGSLEHTGYHMPLENRGYLSLLCQTRNVSAVTGACMMVSCESFDAVGGFDEEFAVTYNDVDFCLRLQKQGKLVAFIPFVELYHHESVTRGRDDEGEKRIRVMKEWSYFWYRWPDYYVEGDPYFNKQFNQHYTRVGYHHLREQ